MDAEEALRGILREIESAPKAAWATSRWTWHVQKDIAPPVPDEDVRILPLLEEEPDVE